MSVLRNAVVMVAALFPLPAMAEVCATAQDLIGGIVVRYDSGGIDTFRRDMRDPAVVLLEAEFDATPLASVRKAHGYIELSVTGPQGESVRYDYGMLPAEMPKPVSGETWEVVATVATAAGAATERQIYTFGPEGTLRIRDCTWRIMAVEMQLADHRAAFYWFPDLGISTPQGEDIHEIVPLALAP